MGILRAYIDSKLYENVHFSSAGACASKRQRQLDMTMLLCMTWNTALCFDSQRTPGADTVLRTHVDRYCEARKPQDVQLPRLVPCAMFYLAQ